MKGLFAVAAWRDPPRFTRAERAVLALTGAVSRLNDQDPAPDKIWQQAVRHNDEAAMAALLVAIAPIDVWNRST